ncbi:CLUMA_CG003843, isoform A [Clunio marinus]|uniref:CLUMA_CG003843, isoform A n=1 Tax=Clunio marinus TaxID=568069 RepID=A0A1J1HQ07_9DIPT|nr:CLUMA_CG003843, isoform A [Clunio marinus]
MVEESTRHNPHEWFHYGFNEVKKKVSGIFSSEIRFGHQKYKFSFAMLNNHHKSSFGSRLFLSIKRCGFIQHPQKGQRSLPKNNKSKLSEQPHERTI